MAARPSFPGGDVEEIIARAHPPVRAAPGRAFAALVAALVVLAGAAACSAPGASPDVVIGVPEATTTSTSGPVILAAPDAAGGASPDDVFVEGSGRAGTRAEPAPSPVLAHPNGAPPGPALAFTSAHPVPDHLVFILVAGSDARPGEDLARARADAVHLLAVNPVTGQGTLVGIPRDSWVRIPGHGRGKINLALSLGGPDLLAATVRLLTGLPVHYYVLTGFTGLTAMVDELGGVDVFVSRRMNDRMSGARFERGWHRMTGAQALAFTRNRNDVANGDFSRAENHGILTLAALAKMRAEVADDAGVARWVGVLLRHVRLDVPRSDLPALGALARRLDPDRLQSVVAPGRVGTAGRQSVVYLTTAAARLFEDLRDDAVVGGVEPVPPEEPPAHSPAEAPAPAGDPPATSPEEGPLPAGEPPAQAGEPPATTTTTAITGEPDGAPPEDGSTTTTTTTEPESSTTSTTEPRRRRLLR